MAPYSYLFIRFQEKTEGDTRTHIVACLLLALMTHITYLIVHLYLENTALF